jgi:hypothetical protein
MAGSDRLVPSFDIDQAHSAGGMSLEFGVIAQGGNPSPGGTNGSKERRSAGYFYCLSVDDK